RTDVRFGGARQHAFGEAAGGLDRLAVEQALLEHAEISVDACLREVRREPRPEPLRGTGWIVIEPAARCAAGAAELLHHLLDQRLAGRRRVGASLGLPL